jgi:hypothetical protein
MNTFVQFLESNLADLQATLQKIKEQTATQILQTLDKVKDHYQGQVTGDPEHVMGRDFATDIQRPGSGSYASTLIHNNGNNDTSIIKIISGLESRISRLEELLKTVKP